MEHCGWLSRFLDLLSVQIKQQYFELVCLLRIVWTYTVHLHVQWSVQLVETCETYFVYIVVQCIIFTAAVFTANLCH